MDDIINNNNNKHRHRRKKKIKKHGGFTCTTEKDCIIAGINFYNENMFLDKDKDINLIYSVDTIFNSGSNFFRDDTTKISNQCFWISVLTFLKIKNKTEINSVSKFKQHLITEYGNRNGDTIVLNDDSNEVEIGFGEDDPVTKAIYLLYDLYDVNIIIIQLTEGQLVESVNFLKIKESNNYINLKNKNELNDDDLTIISNKIIEKKKNENDNFHNMYILNYQNAHFELIRKITLFNENENKIIHIPLFSENELKLNENKNYITPIIHNKRIIPNDVVSSHIDELKKIETTITEDFSYVFNKTKKNTPVLTDLRSTENQLREANKITYNDDDIHLTSNELIIINQDIIEIETTKLITNIYDKNKKNDKYLDDLFQSILNYNFNLNQIKKISIEKKILKDILVTIDSNIYIIMDAILNSVIRDTYIGIDIDKLSTLNLNDFDIPELPELLKISGSHGNTIIVNINTINNNKQKHIKEFTIKENQKILMAYIILKYIKNDLDKCKQIK